MLKDVLFWALDNNTSKPTRAFQPPIDNILHYACKKGYLPVVKMLVEDKKMSCNAPGEYSNIYPTQRAIESRNVELLKYLKSKGATICTTYAKQLYQNMLRETDTSLAEFFISVKVFQSPWAFNILVPK